MIQDHYMLSPPPEGPSSHSKASPLQRSRPISGDVGDGASGTSPLFIDGDSKGNMRHIDKVRRGSVSIDALLEKHDDIKASPPTKWTNPFTDSGPGHDPTPHEFFTFNSNTQTPIGGFGGFSGPERQPLSETRQVPETKNYEAVRLRIDERAERQNLIAQLKETLSKPTGSIAQTNLSLGFVDPSPFAPRDLYFNNAPSSMGTFGHPSHPHAIQMHTDYASAAATANDPSRFNGKGMMNGDGPPSPREKELEEKIAKLESQKESELEERKRMMQYMESMMIKMEDMTHGQTVSSSNTRSAQDTRETPEGTPLTHRQPHQQHQQLTAQATGGISTPMAQQPPLQPSNATMGSHLGPRSEGPIFDATPLGSPPAPFSHQASTSLRPRNGLSGGSGGIQLGVSLARSPKPRNGRPASTGPAPSPVKFSGMDGGLHHLSSGSQVAQAEAIGHVHRPMESTAPDVHMRHMALRTDKFREPPSAVMAAQAQAPVYEMPETPKADKKKKKKKKKEPDSPSAGGNDAPAFSFGDVVGVAQELGPDLTAAGEASGGGSPKKGKKSSPKGNVRFQENGEGGGGGGGDDDDGEGMDNPAAPGSEAWTKELKRKKNKMKKSIMAMIRMKQSLKRTIKDWQSDFEEKNGRPPNKEEKAMIHDKYMAYAMMNKHLKALQTEASVIEEDITRKVG